MTRIKWEEPGPSQRERYDWISIFTELRQRPGQWALILEDAPTSTATHIKNGKYVAGALGEFEATTREVKKSRGKIYARYVGGGKR